MDNKSKNGTLKKWGIPNVIIASDTTHQRIIAVNIFFNRNTTVLIILL